MKFLKKFENKDFFIRPKSYSEIDMINFGKYIRENSNNSSVEELLSQFNNPPSKVKSTDFKTWDETDENQY